MLFAKALVVGASFVVAALAQAKIQFTSQPSNVKVGVPVEVTWINGDNTPVTITLREGKSTDLKDVEVLTTTGKGGSFTWTPSKSLADGSDYALQISQSGVPNFTGQFSISGGSGSKTSASVTKLSSASVTKSSSASVTESSSESITSAATTVSLTSSHKSLVVVTSKIALNSSIPVIGTGVSFGTSGGIHITRNQTLSRPTLTATKSSAFSTSEAGSGSSGGSGGSGSTGGSSGGATTSATSAPGSSAAATLASPLALVLCALVAVVYLG